jgi:hypothetical protein
VLFRRLFLEMLVAAHDAGRLQFFGDHVGLADRAAWLGSAAMVFIQAAISAALSEASNRRSTSPRDGSTVCA